MLACGGGPPSEGRRGTRWLWLVFARPPEIRHLTATDRPKYLRGFCHACRAVCGECHFFLLIGACVCVLIQPRPPVLARPRRLSPPLPNAPRPPPSHQLRPRLLRPRRQRAAASCRGPRSSSPPPPPPRPPSRPLPPPPSAKSVTVRPHSFHSLFEIRLANF